MKKVVFWIVPLFIFVACQKDSETRHKLDVQLEYVINKTSEGKGKEYFILPQSDHFVDIPQDPKIHLLNQKSNLENFYSMRQA